MTLPLLFPATLHDVSLLDFCILADIQNIYLKLHTEAQHRVHILLYWLAFVQFWFCELTGLNEMN